MGKIKKVSIDYEVDILCLTKINKNQRNVHQDNTIWNGTSGCKENRRVQVSYNKTFPCSNQSESQVGSTAMVAFQDVVLRIIQQEQEKRKLGRWSYIRITGKTKLNPQL